MKTPCARPGRRRIPFFLAWALLAFGYATGLNADESLTITEFAAGNTSGLRDEDGAYSDWIEILNAGTSPANLDGWFLTDTEAILAKWRFPATNVPPGGFLLVFASGKNRALAGAPLHANFSLDADGEYLALVKPDGISIASEFAPTFPDQFANISYGIGQNLEVTRLVSNTSPARVLVPTNGTLSLSWTSLGFDDSSWRVATNGVGYETYITGFAVRNIRANVGVCDLGTAEGVLVNPAQQAAVFTETRGVINYLSTDTSANFPGDFTFPGFTIGVDENNFVTEATGILTIPSTGSWTFGVNSDDGFRCTIGTNVFSYPAPRGPGDTLATFNLPAGDHAVRLVFYECGGGAEVEFFAAPGVYGAFNPAFRLVGNTAGGGLAVKSLPTGASGSLRSLITTDIQTNLLNRNASAYLRLPLTVPDPAAFSSLTLRVKYDDGFVAYLNGTEIARRNSPAAPSWNASATSSRPSSSVAIFEEIDVTSRLGLLQAGANVLAIQGLNVSASDTDFFFLAELVQNKILGLTNHYFALPSPGGVNGSGFYAFVENLKFDPGRGWFDSTNVSVVITSATPGLTIRYTTNGLAPTPTSGLLYSPGGIPIGRTTLLRAVGYRAGFEPTDVETHSYLFLNQVQAQSTNVNWAGGSSENYTLATNITRSALYGPSFKNDLLAVPTLSIVMAPADVFGPSGVWSNPQAEGVAWERPCSLEYMRPDGGQGFHVNCGIRIQGGASRNLVPKHGLRVLFKSLYGPGKLDYPLYPDSAVQEFDTLTLHATFNDHWSWGGTAAQMQRDQWCRDTQNAMGGYGPHGTYVHLYLNGLYWGLYNIGEKGDASYAAHYLGGEKEEYDAFNSDETVDGDRAAWDAMFAIANAGIANDTAYTNLSRYLNIPNFIDYMLMNFYSANTDWPGHNWNAARRRLPGAGFHFFCWDAEWTFGIGNDVTTDRTGESGGSPGVLYSRLRAHPEFRREFGDHAQKHLLNDGALTPGPAQSRWMKRAAEIERAIVAESARWGGGNTRQTWLNAQSQVLAWFPQRSAILLNQLRNAGLYPQLKAPGFSQPGGLVPPAFPLTLTNANGSGAIYFTIDGSDPRLWGGGLAPSARFYLAPLVLTNATTVRARVRDGANWSALVEATFYLVQDFAGLKVTEIMYNPPAFTTYPGDEVEFLELKNTGTNSLDLSGLHFTDGFTFTFTNGSRLAPGTFAVLARNSAVFKAKYPGVAMQGLYEGRLDNNGETLTLAPPLGTNIFSFSYDQAVPWPITPNGYGFSLVPVGLAGGPGAATSWRPSTLPGGSPGADDPLANIPGIVINEILTHTDPPELDAVELFNPTPTNVHIGGWFLSDHPLFPKKFRIPNGTMITGGGYAVFDETHLNPQPGVPPSFALNAHGESLYLFSGDGAANLSGYSHSFEYGTAATGVTFGRQLISTGEEFWPAQSAMTLGTANSIPRSGPLVLNEILFHPSAGYDEFVEIHNVSSDSVPLFDPAFPTNSWRLNGLAYTFSNNLSVPAGGFLLVVPIDPATFRAKYGLAPAVQIVGPYMGVLQDSGERLRLERPDAPEPGTNGLVTVPYIVVDEVRFNDKPPWPAGADGDGPSLQKSAPDAYGNEPTNWFASGITPGAANLFNQPPLCAFASPAHGAAFVVPAEIALQANVSDPDGLVVKVEYFDGELKVGEATNAPFAFTWIGASAGLHTLVAKARDNGLAVTPSAPITITVTPPPLGSGLGLRGDYYDNIDFTGPRLRRLDPVIGFDWGGGAPDPSMGPEQFSVRWLGQVQPRFSETYTFHTVSDDGVRLWVNNQLIVDSWIDQSPTEHTGIIALQAGHLYDIKMDFYEGGGGAVATLSWSAPSVPREIIPATQLYPPLSSNLPPSVVLTNPATGGVFVATSTVDLFANATDPDGAVLKVEFFAGATRLGDDNTSPFGFAWANVPAGTHLLRAVVTDDSGIVRTSAPVSISVVAGFTSNHTLIATGAVWRFLDNGSDQASTWTALEFNDSGWSNGPAQLGYGDGDERTLVGYGPDIGAKFITTYYRHTFNVSDPAAFTALTLRLLRDDGAVVWLNDSEIYRINMPPGPLTYSTPALINVSAPEESTFFSAPVNPGYLTFGNNVVAVEIHQNSGGSSDISFDFELLGVQSYLAPLITTQPQSQVVGIGSGATFSAVASGTAPLRYQWRLNGTNLTGATNSTLALPDARIPDAGNYSLVVTNIAGSATSQVATLTVSVFDLDEDGMPDVWENANGLNPNVNDASADVDQDGMTNLQEYLAGTDPRNAASLLRIDIFSGDLRIRFTAQSNKVYTVWSRSVLGSGGWKWMTNFPAAPLVRNIEVLDPAGGGPSQRYFRLSTP